MQVDNRNKIDLKSNLFDKKLIGYSLAAGAVLAGGDSFAAVQHSGILNTQVTFGPAYPLKIMSGTNTVGTQSFYLYFSTFSSSTTAYAAPLSGLLNAGTSAPFIQAFSNSQVIGTGSQVFGNNYLLDVCTYSYGFLGNFANRGGDGQRYIGIRFNQGGIHYGWIRVKVDLFPITPQKITIYDYAYETTVGATIQTDNSLAVALTSFTAGVESNAVALAWTTQSEVDNTGFTIERKQVDVDGNVIADWMEIASYQTHTELEGQGNTSEATDYDFKDYNVVERALYQYRLNTIDTDGNRVIYNVIQVEVVSTMPEGMVLLQNFPNPFNPATTIEFSIPEQDNVTLSIYNLKGQTVDVLVNEQMSAGPHHVSWDGSDQPAGVYFYELRTGSHREIRKLTLIK